MKTEEEVLRKIAEYKTQGIPISDAAWNTAKECVGWPYVFGAWGQECTPNNRRKQTKADNSNCQVIAGTSSGCGGCKWFPNEERVLMFDCRGFTGGVLEQFGIKISRTGATSQWKGYYWEAKGTIDTIPDDVLVCLFYPKKNEPAKMEHTGFGLNNETIECSSGVQHFTTRNKKWTHWGVPACCDGSVTPSDPVKPTLRRGDKGAWVTLAQTELINQGYSCGSTGADGDFGKNTEAAVKRFQNDHKDENGNPLKVDGVIGQSTWNALDGAEPAIKYTVTVPGLTATQADALIMQYPGSTKKEERG